MAAFDFAKVKDPTFFKENVLNAHASFRTYASREEYLAGESSLALKLDGIWKFAYAKNYTSAIPGFEKTDYDCSGWDDIHVPAHGNRCCGHQFKIMPDRTGSEVGFVLKMKGGRLYYENTRRL